MRYQIATLLCDFYKISHREQYPKGTSLVYSTWTSRGSRIKDIQEVVAFGIQGFIQEFLIDFFDERFFHRNIDIVLLEYRRVIRHTLGIEDPDVAHIEALHRLGHLPLLIRAVPEGTRVPVRVPMMTIENTDDRFFWLTNYIESLMSCELWQSMTSATLAARYRSILDKHALETAGSTDLVQFQGHDFSFRGMAGLAAAAKSGAGHLLSFSGTDTIPAILYLEEYYGANVEHELVGASIPATEHSVMCAHGPDELAAYRHLVTEVYPKGFVSIVSDTWDLWSVLTKVVAQLKTEILSRDGRVVIRPDSGDPVLIICGDPDGTSESARKGVIEVLWDIFGGTTTPQGFRVLDSHIGCIYGDAITLDRCEAICTRLRAKGFASTNMVYGIGSFTYQYVTRDTFEFAMKSTLCVIDGCETFIFKSPVTDSGMKWSARGGVRVFVRDNKIQYEDGLSLDQTRGGLLEPVFHNGRLLRQHTLADIRKTMSDRNQA